MSRLMSILIDQLRTAVQQGVDRVSDAELLARFVRNRDAAAFELLFWRHGPMIWGVCRRLLGDTPDAEDAYQAVFVVLARKAATIGRGEALAGWLHRVARRTALNARTSRQRRTAHEEAMSDLSDLSELPGRDDPVRRLEGREIGDLLDQELLKLPEKFRQPLLLCDLEDRSHEEAAAMLDCPIGTLNSRLARGRKKLKERLLRRGVTLTAQTVTAVPPAVSAAALHAVMASPSESVGALADGVIHALTLSAMKKIAMGVGLCVMLFAGLACAAAFAAKVATTAAAPPDPPIANAGAQTPDSPAAARAVAPDAEPQAVVVGKVVDEAGKPVAGATVSAIRVKKTNPVISGSDGGFRLPLGYPARDGLYVVLRAEDTKGRLGYLSVSQKKPAQVQVVVKPSHELTILVTDSDKKPVAGAEVFFLADVLPIAGGRTDAEGRWIGRVPADATDWSVFARKGKAGFDYALAQTSRSRSTPLLPVPSKLRLTLDGARTLRIKTVDREGKPIQGVAVGPWYLRKPDHDEDINLDINLSGTMDSWPATGKDGTVVLDWLPQRFVYSIPIMTRHEDYYAINHGASLLHDKPTSELVVTLLPMERLSGRVTHPDGQPAAGIEVRVEGQGDGINGFRNIARTDAGGRYTMKVYSEQAYIVAVTDDRWAAPYRGGFVVRAGKAFEGVDFVLGRPTRLHGRVTVGKNDRPAAATSLRVDIDLGEIPAELRRKDDRTYHAVQMSFFAETDKDGRYEFRLGPGAYKLIGPAQKETVAVTIPTINPPAEIARDFRMQRPETGSLAGDVVDADGRPLAGVVVEGRYATQTGAWFNDVKTDGQGRFKVVRTLERLVLHAQTSDRTRGGIARLDPDASKAKIVVGPLTSASGRLLDLAGKPLADKKLPYGIRIYQGDSEQSPYMESFGGRATTDAQGRFTLKGLIPGEAYDVSLQLEKDSWLAVTQVRPKSTRPADLGDLRVDPTPYKPYVPPTPAERAARAFAPGLSTSANVRKAKVLAESGREYTRPLLLFGRRKDPACIELFRLFNENVEESGTDREKRLPSPAKLRWEFELASLDVDQPDVRKLAEELHLATGKGQPPVLAVLNADGSLAATFSLALDKQQKLDVSSLAAFLVKHKPPTRDAETMLAVALRKAKAEDKRVFFIASASWCAPCRLLSRFLASRKEILQRHYVFVKLDISRDKHAAGVRARFKSDQDGGVPWYAILDAEGKVLVTSNATEEKRGGKPKNIGFPSSAAGIEHFVKMIEQTAPRMTAGEIGELRKALGGR